MALTETHSVWRFPIDVADDEASERPYFLIQIYNPNNASSIGSPRTTTEAITGKLFQNADSVKIPYGSTMQIQQFQTTMGKTLLKQAIALPMPDNFNLLTGVQYNSSYTADQAVQSMDTLASGIANGNTLGAIGELFGSSAMKGIQGIISKYTNSNIANDATNRLGVAVNPMKEVIFEGHGFRSFDFNWALSARSFTDSVMIKQIYQSLRYYMLPELSQNKKFYTFPGTFIIQPMLGGKINPSIPKFMPMVLESCNISFNPTGGPWASHKDGSPVRVNLSCRFQETQLVDRSIVEQGWTEGY